MINYATLEDLKLVMGESWVEAQADLAERLLNVSSAGLRKIFKTHSLNLDEMILTGEIEQILVNQIVCDMVARNLKQVVSPLGGGDFSQMSQSAGGYSISVSTNGNNLYLKREEIKWLGLPSLSLTKINLFGEDAK